MTHRMLHLLPISFLAVHPVVVSDLPYAVPLVEATEGVTDDSTVNRYSM